MNRMIRVQKQVLAGIICLILAGSPVFLLSANGAEIAGDLYSTGAVLMDGVSGRVLFSKN